MAGPSPEGETQVPTRHRQEMIDAGLAEPRGHDRRAVAQSKRLAKADQDLLDQAEKDRKTAAAVADAALAEKRARRAARHEAELSGKTPARKVR